MEFNNKLITEETKIKTDKHFADICQGCIDGAISGKFRVNDIEKYIKSNKASIEISLNGEGRNNFTYWQRAYYIQEGECIALLP
tara:strand:+ start:207 stop:458 length:252 start_codon:yes stop_codon:yes gene_type:complete